jgi:hypothetical protein
MEIFRRSRGLWRVGGILLPLKFFRQLALIVVLSNDVMGARRKGPVDPNGGTWPFIGQRLDAGDILIASHFA